MNLPNAYEFNGATYLWLACRLNKIELVKLLVEEGKANVNFRCHPEATALREEAAIHTCARFNHHEILAYLLSHPLIQVNRLKDDGATAMFLSVQQGNIESFKLLIEAGADINLRRYDITPCLLMSVQG